MIFTRINTSPRWWFWYLTHKVAGIASNWLSGLTLFAARRAFDIAEEKRNG